MTAAVNGHEYELVPCECDPDDGPHCITYELCRCAETEQTDD